VPFPPKSKWYCGAAAVFICVVCENPAGIVIAAASSKPMSRVVNDLRIGIPPVLLCYFNYNRQLTEFQWHFLLQYSHFVLRAILLQKIPIFHPNISPNPADTIPAILQKRSNML
jgi:hypothetical protein